MAVTVTNLLQGPATLYTAPVGTAEPTAANGTLDAAWIDVGGTDGGVRQTVGQTYSNLVVDQIALPVGSRLVEQSITVATSLAEATLANLRLAWNQTGTGTTTELDSTISNADPNYKALLIVGQKPGGGDRVVIVRRALSTESVEQAWTKDGKTMIPVTFTGFYVSSSTKALKVDDGVTVVDN